MTCLRWLSPLGRFAGSRPAVAIVPQIPNNPETVFHLLTIGVSVKIMTIYAHPADTITNCGGTLARHADAGDETVALILTHGGRIHPNQYAEEWRKDDPDAARKSVV